MDILDRDTEEHVEQLADLLINLAHEVLVTRPLSVSRYLAEYLMSRLDKRTLWLMQMEKFIVETRKSLQTLNEQERDANSNTRGSYFSYLCRKKEIREHEVLTKKVAEYSDVARKIRKSRKENDFNSHQKEPSNKKSFKCPHEIVNKMADLDSDKRNDKVGAPKEPQPKKKALIPSSEALGLKRKVELASETTGPGDETTAYKKVASSINVLIDIEKDFKKCGTEYGVYKLLKTTKGKSSERESYENPGILESSCLKPSVFKKLLVGKSTNLSFHDQAFDENMSSFVVTGRPNDYRVETKEPKSSYDEETAAEAESQVKADGKPCVSDSSSTSIQSTYEYNKHLTSSSTECLLGHLKKSRKILPYNKSGSSKSSSASSLIEADEKVEASRDDSAKVKAHEAAKVQDGDTGDKRADDEAVGVEPLGGKGAFNDRSERASNSSLWHVSLYRCPEQCDFFKAEDSSVAVPFRLAGRFSAGQRGSANDKRPRRNHSDTDARAPDWTEYCLGLAPPSISAHLLNTFEVGPGGKSTGPEGVGNLRLVDSLSETSKVPAETEADGVNDGSPGIFDPSLTFDNYLARKTANMTDVSIGSNETSVHSECNFEGGASRPKLKSMPCPSLYYQTTWLDSNCSLEVPDEIRRSTRPCDESVGNNSTFGTQGVSSGWISMDEDFFVGGGGGGGAAQPVKDESEQCRGIAVESKAESAVDRSDEKSDPSPEKMKVPGDVGDERCNDVQAVGKIRDAKRPVQGPVPSLGSVACRILAFQSKTNNEGTPTDHGHHRNRKRHAPRHPEQEPNSPPMSRWQAQKSSYQPSDETNGPNDGGGPAADMEPELPVLYETDL